MFPGEIAGGVKPALIGKQRVSHFTSVRKELSTDIIFQINLTFNDKWQPAIHYIYYSN